MVEVTAIPVLIGCRDGCGTKSPSPGQEGWYFLEACKLWRCPSCAHQLDVINTNLK